MATIDSPTQPEPMTADAIRPASELITGVDVSHHQQDLDFEAVREAGHRFAIMKVTENNDHLDTYFSTYVGQARAAGLEVGAYHVFDYTLDGKSQADHYVDRVEQVIGFDGLLPPVVDVECWPAYYGASIHSVSAARLRDFVDEVYRRTGMAPVVYTSEYMWREVVGNPDGFADLPLWAACWGCDQPITLPEGWDDWTFWQDGLTKIPGRRARVDGNYFAGSGQQLRSLVQRPFSIAGGAVATAGGTVALDLGGRRGSEIRTSLDGEEWSDWQALRPTPTVEIGTAEGEYVVYAQLKDGPGLLAPVVSDTIVVDATPPEVTPPSVGLRLGPLVDGLGRYPGGRGVAGSGRDRRPRWREGGGRLCRGLADERCPGFGRTGRVRDLAG